MRDQKACIQDTSRGSEDKIPAYHTGYKELTHEIRLNAGSTLQRAAEEKREAESADLSAILYRWYILNPASRSDVPGIPSKNQPILSFNSKIANHQAHNKPHIDIPKKITYDNPPGANQTATPRKDG